VNWQTELDLVVAQEVRDNGGSEPAKDNTLFCGDGDAIHHLGTGFSYMGESDQEFREQKLLVARCRIYNTLKSRV